MPPKFGAQKEVDTSEEVIVEDAEEGYEFIEAPSTFASQQTNPYSAMWTSIKGAMKHSLFSWVKGSSEDVILENPYFDPSLGVEHSIYCIHGTADRSLAFGEMIHELLKTQKGVAANLLPTTIRKIYLLSFVKRAHGESIEFFATQVKHKLIVYGDKHVIFLAHSRGSLVATEAVENICKEIGVAFYGVFAFGGPYHGSPFAVFPLTAVSTSVAQMHSDSEYLKKLRKLIEASKNRKIYYFFGATYDSIVPLERSYVEAEGCVFIWIDGEGHLAMLNSPEVLRYVVEGLQTVTKHAVIELPKIPPMMSICLKLDAAIFALEHRVHVFSNKPKIEILKTLKSYLSDMCEGDRGELFPEAKTIGEFISAYLNTIDQRLHISFRDVMTEQLNPSFFCAAASAPKSLNFIDALIQQYDSDCLPEHKINAIRLD